MQRTIIATILLATFVATAGCFGPGEEVDGGSGEHQGTADGEEPSDPGVNPDPETHEERRAVAVPGFPLR